MTLEFKIISVGMNNEGKVVLHFGEPPNQITFAMALETAAFLQAELGKQIARYVEELRNP